MSIEYFTSAHQNEQKFIIVGKTYHSKPIQPNINVFVVIKQQITVKSLQLHSYNVSRKHTNKHKMTNTDTQKGTNNTKTL